MATNEFALIKSWHPLSQAEGVKRSMAPNLLTELWKKVVIAEPAELAIEVKSATAPADEKKAEQKFSHFEISKDGRTFTAIEQRASYRVELTADGAKITLLNHKLQPAGVPKNFNNMKYALGKHLYFPYDQPVQCYNGDKMTKLKDKVRVDLLENTIFRPSRFVQIVRGWLYFTTYSEEKKPSELIRVKINSIESGDPKRQVLASKVEDFFVTKALRCCVLTAEGELKFLGKQKKGCSVQLSKQEKYTTLAQHKSYVVASSCDVQKGNLSYFLATQNPLKEQHCHSINSTAKWTMICPSLTIFERQSGTYVLGVRYSQFIDLFGISQMKLVPVFAAKKIGEENKCIYTSALLQSDKSLDLVYYISGKVFRLKITGL
jgi:hypothetical protein